MIGLHWVAAGAARPGTAQTVPATNKEEAR